MDYIVHSIYNTAVNIHTKTLIGHGTVISILLTDVSVDLLLTK